MIKHLLVAGGGTAGFILALTLKRRFNFKVTMLIPKDIGIVGVGEGSTEHFSQWINYNGWDKERFIIETGATIKAGTMYKGWNPKQDFMHSLGANVQYRLGLLKPFFYEAMIEGLSPLSLVSSRHPESIIQNTGAPFESIWQFHFNTFKLNDFLTKEAKKIGIKIIDDKINHVKTGPQGIKELIGEKKNYKADFYIDSTGFRKLLISSLGAKWVSSSDYLKLNEAIAFPTEDEDQYNTYTEATAMNAGWKWRVPVWGRFGNGYVYDNNYINKDQAVAEIEKVLGYKIKIAKHIKYDPGKLDRSWIKNCVAVGLSSNFLEPLEATSITATIHQAYILMHRMSNYDQTSIDDYNRAITNILDDARDFVAMRFMVKGKGTKFWKELPSRVKIPEKIQHFQKIWKTRLLDDLDFDTKNNRYCMFWADYYNMVAYGQGLIKGKNLIKYYKGIRKELLTQAHFNRGSVYGYIDLKSGRLGALPQKEYLRQLRETGSHAKIKFPSNLDYIPKNWERPRCINEFIKSHPYG